MDGVRLKRPSYHDHCGFLMPMGFAPDGFDSGLQYRAGPGDIFVCTYPKCGTTWAQYIVYLLLNGGRALAPKERLSDRFPHLEEVGREVVERLPPPRLIKTHLPYSLTPRHASARYLYVARNPFDCAVSLYHHTRGFVRHYDFADGTFEDFFECFIEGTVDFGDYFDNLLPWLEHVGDDNVELSTFEAMKAAPADAVARIARFVGGPAVSALEDPAFAARVLDESSFTRMRVDQLRWASERPRDMPAFVRSGVVGDWRNCFTPTQARRLIDKFDRLTRGTRAATLWPDILADAREFAG